eukprot:12476027-Alexandrium_andersonii.AAC.1
MSASLVGSEMCIRDRSISVAGGSYVAQEPQRRPTLLLGRAPTRRNGRNACLLYTSDAADDM